MTLPKGYKPPPTSNNNNNNNNNNRPRSRKRSVKRSAVYAIVSFIFFVFFLMLTYGSYLNYVETGKEVEKAKMDLEKTKRDYYSQLGIGRAEIKSTIP
ncbi:MAG: hypothetical protein ACR2F1_12055 [Nitrososphaeraceae archaeon]